MDAVKNGTMKNEIILRCATKAGRPRGSAPLCPFLKRAVFKGSHKENNL